MQTPGNTYTGRCSHCGAKDCEVKVFKCTYPDEKVVVERLCNICEGPWGRFLTGVGCVLDPVPQPAFGKPGGLVKVEGALTRMG